MKKRALLLLLALCLLSGCGEARREEPVVCVPAEECFLCTGTWRRNNVGIISLNTFEVAEVEINRYDAKGTLDETAAGIFSMQGQQLGEDGLFVFMALFPDRGYASLTLEPGSDQWADRRKAAGSLCGDCLEKILPEEGPKKMGFGAIDLSTGEVSVFERQTVGFVMRDFYAHCDWEDDGPNLELMIFYAPFRY